ncbi:MAG TPA: PatB family C-S lyase [Burkholderiales bacterium]|nr:PatB family C-S lyase [Burkholderiales bacterium]
MEFDFDRVIDRRGTASSKWNKYGERDVIPMWVADMDFACAPAIVDALRKRVDHPIYGYSEAPPGLVDATIAHLESGHGWKIEPEWIVWLPGLVVGLNVVSRAFGPEGSEVLTAVPIYPPFLSAPANAGRNAVRVQMIETGDGWRWDLAALERAITPDSKLLLLCNPHNPVGRVFSQQELRAIADICIRHNITLCSDEIHAGLILDLYRKHVPLASLGEDIAQRTVTLQSASKTFNLPALGCAYAIASNPDVRAKIRKVMAGIVHHVGMMGFVATEAAYRFGKEWQAALLDYLRANRDLVEREIGNMPGLRIGHAEATYLSWIDARELPVENPANFFTEAGVGLYDGALFGAPGFLRLNFACPRSLLEQALEHMSRAVGRLRS